MNTEMDSAELQVVYEATSVNATVPDTTINVTVGEGAKIEVGEAITYIKSGQAEIGEAVAAGKIVLDNHTTAKIGEFNSNATEKTNAFNSNATDKTTAFNNNATSKTNDFNDNASEKTTDFNDNATSKKSDFNSNASDKTTDFNDNYTAKKEIIDGQVDLAKDWATKTDGKVDGVDYSAKYYAEQTASLLSTKQDTLVSGTNIKTINNNSILGSGNLDIDGLPSQTGQSGKFLTTNGSAASWGSPTIPTVNDATLTIQKNSTDVATFTANASSNVTANISVPTDTSDLTNGAGFITGITSTDVTTALGYTPYDSSNPSGYTSNVGTVTSVNNTQPDSNGNVSLTIPTVDQTYDGTSTNAQSGVAVAQALAGFSGANTDLSNLTSQGQNIANWSSNVTNCITEIPQDIKLELNNGTLKLKAGSKVYVPNGVGVFDVVTVPSDVVFHSGTIGTDTYNLMLCCNLTGDFGIRADPNYFVSGATAPSNTSRIWYDTTNNAIKKYENGSWVRAYSLPIGIYVRTNGVATSIDQVFNGFGYIGSTVFALPGVKGLIPNGRNADGSLKNTEFVYNSVKTVQNTTYRPNAHLVCFINYIAFRNTLDYNEKLNLNWQGSAYTNQEGDGGLVSISSTSPYAITSFTPKTAFHALDYNDSSIISGWSAPSDRYIDLTLGASGATYTAPANGWVYLKTNARSSSTPAFSIIGISGTDLGMSSTADVDVNWDADVILPVKQGQIFWVRYGTINSNYTKFRFIYAEGEN